MDEEEFQAITTKLSQDMYVISTCNMATAAKIYGDNDAVRIVILSQFKHLMRLVAFANDLDNDQMQFLAERVNQYIQEQVSSIKSAPSSN